MSSLFIFCQRISNILMKKKSGTGKANSHTVLRHALLLLLLQGWIMMLVLCAHTYEIR